METKFRCLPRLRYEVSSPPSPEGELMETLEKSLLEGDELYSPPSPEGELMETFHTSPSLP